MRREWARRVLEQYINFSSGFILTPTLMLDLFLKAGEIRWQTRLPCVVDMRRSTRCRNLLIFNFHTILSFSLLYLLLVHTMHRRQKMSMIILHLMRDFLLVEKSERRMVCCGWTACWVCQVLIFSVSLLNVSAARAFQEGIFTVSERLEAKPDV